MTDKKLRIFYIDSQHDRCGDFVANGGHNGLIVHSLVGRPDRDILIHLENNWPDAIVLADIPAEEDLTEFCDQVGGCCPVILLVEQGHEAEGLNAIEHGVDDLVFRDKDGMWVARLAFVIKKTLLQIHGDHRVTNLRTSRRYLEGLVRISAVIAKHDDPVEMLRQGAAILLEIFQADRIWILHHGSQSVSGVRDPIEIGQQRYCGVLTPKTEMKVKLGISEILQEALKLNRPAVRYGEYENPLCRKAALSYRIRSQICLALRPKYDQPWLLCMHQCSRERRWSKNHIQLFQDICDRLRDAFDHRLLLASLKKDIAKRQKVEARLLESKQRFQSLFSSSGIALWLLDYTQLNKLLTQLRRYSVTDLDRYIEHNREFLTQAASLVSLVDINDAAIKLCSAQRKEDVTTSACPLLTPEASSVFHQLLLSLFSGKSHFITEGVQRNFHGKHLDVLMSIDILPRHSQRRQLLLNIIDISRLKKTERALRESETRYRQLLDASNDAIIVADAETGVIVEANRRLVELTGKPLYQLIGMHHSVLHPTMDHQRYNESFRRQVQEGVINDQGDSYLIHANGRRVPVIITGSVFQSGGRRLVQRNFHDISDRKKEAQHRRLLATAIEQADETIIITNAEGTIVYVNPAFEWTSGYSREEVIGENARILKSGHQDRAFYEKMWKQISAGKVWHGHLTNKKKEGTLYEEEVTISPVRNEAGRITHYVAVKRDVSEQIALERQIRRSQKMDAIGTLATGIAHDFNNILMQIVGFTEMSLDLAEEDSMLKKNLEIIYEASERAGDLVDQILTFSSHTEQNEMPLRLDTIIKKELDLIRSTMPPHIELRQNIATMKMVKMDPIQAHQIVMNLCTNAIQALGDRAGFVEVKLEECELESQKARLLGDLRPGSYLRLSVKDNGPGISPEVIERIFEPYFSTKEKSKDRGTGLGLATIHGIAVRLGGTVSVKSTLGRGSRFDVYFPVTDAKKDILENTESRQKKTPAKQVLVVDDDPQVISYLERELSKLGYEIRGFTSSLKALDAICNEPDAYDVLLADMTMPELSGPQLAEEIRKLGNDIPIILCTEFSKRTENALTKMKGIDGYLTKPITEAQLAEEIGKVTEERPVPG